VSPHLSPDEWHRLEALVDAVLEAGPDRRDAIVAELSGGDPITRAELEHLATECDRASRLMERPAAELFAELFDDTAAELAASIATRYRVIRRLGQGGMAIVFLARDVRHPRDVAIKVVRPHLTESFGHARFLREIEIASRLRHPHIVPLYDSGEVNGTLYYVMPYEDGRSLRERLTNEGRLPTDDAMVVLRDICDALAHAHRHGVIHRDIKPENILLSGKHALVADFGVARAMSEAFGNDTVTMAGVAVGTPAYMAPEQAIPSSPIDHRADIYSFGVLAYEVLTGQRPNIEPRTNLTSALQASIAHDSVVPAHLAGVIMRCIETDPDARWQSTDELLERLDHPVPPIVAAAPIRRTPGRWGAMTKAAAVVAVVVALAGTAWKLSRGKLIVDPTRVAVIRFRNETNTDSLRSLGAILADAIAYSLARTSGLNVVPAMSISSRPSSSDSPTGPELESLARQTGAGLIIGGSYSLDGDSLTIRTEVFDVRQRRALGSVEPVTVHRTETQAGLMAVRERVLVAVAGRLNPQLAESAPLRRLPMSMAAFNEYADGLNAYYAGALDEALTHLYRAIELDSTSASAVLLAAQVEWARSFNLAKVDSLLEMASRLKSLMPAYDQAHYEWLRKYLDGDLPGVLAAARGRSDLERGNAVVQASMRLNHLDTAYALMRDQIREPVIRHKTVPWEFWTQILHVRGEHSRELKEARKAAANFQSIGSEFGDIIARTLEIRALSAIGDSSELVKRLVELHELRPASPAFASAARELRWHRHPSAAVEQLAARWYQEALGRSPTRLTKILLARTLFESGQRDRARPLFQELAADSLPEGATADRARGYDLVPLGYLGIDAALRGDTSAALGFIDQLGRMNWRYRLGMHHYWQARIAAQLGRCDRTVALLRDALRAGESVYDALEYELRREVAEFAPLQRTCPSYQQLMTPTG
jgi:serine/threonine protein kinase